jgi:hypothetical protein
MKEDELEARLEAAALSLLPLDTLCAVISRKRYNQSHYVLTKTKYGAITM